jgi:hypothetical protein
MYGCSKKLILTAVVLLLGSFSALAGYHLEWQSPPNTVWVNLGNILEEGQTPPSGYDVDGDGRGEILTLHETGLHDEPRELVYRAIDSQTYVEKWTWSGHVDGSYEYFHLKGFFDIDEDGEKEVIFHYTQTRVDPYEHRVFALDLATGTQEWEVVSGMYYEVATIRDTDDDGYYEIVLHLVTTGLEVVTQIWGGDPGVSVPQVPAGVNLSQNHPNPFNPSTQIEYSLDHAGPVQLRILSPSGRQVCTLLDKIQGAGHHTLTWDGRDASGRRMPSGTYFYEIKVESGRSSKKMILLQ